MIKSNEKPKVFTIYGIEIEGAGDLNLDSFEKAIPKSYDVYFALPGEDGKTFGGLRPVEFGVNLPTLLFYSKAEAIRYADKVAVREIAKLEESMAKVADFRKKMMDWSQEQERDAIRRE